MGLWYIPMPVDPHPWCCLLILKLGKNVKENHIKPCCTNHFLTTICFSSIISLSLPACAFYAWNIVKKCAEQHKHDYLKIDKVMLETWLFHNLIKLQNFRIYRRIAEVCKNVSTNDFNNRIIYIIFWRIEEYNIVISKSQIQNIPSIGISIYDTVFDIF